MGGIQPGRFLGAAVTACLCASACAHGRESALIIQAQPLGNALNAVAQNGKVSIIFRSDVVKNHRVRAQRLTGTAQEMATTLLKGTGLRLSGLGDNVYLVERSQNTPPVLHAVPEHIIEPVQPIIVTALRRPTPLDDTPISMVAIAGRTLSNGHVRRVTDLGLLAPSLNTTSNNPGFERLSIRGVQAAGEATVGLYYGNAFVTGPGATSADPGLMTPSLLLVDVDRVEVLRGPQGTLFGAGSLAGTVRILFNKPELDHVAGETSFEISDAQGAGPDGFASGIANIPLTKGQSAIRLVAYRRGTSGRINDIMLGRKHADRRMETGGRLNWRLEPGQRWRVDMAVAYQQDQVADGFSETLSLGYDTSARLVATPYSSRFFLADGSVTGPVGKLTLDANFNFSRWTPHRSLDITGSVLNNAVQPEACMRYFALSSHCSPSQQAGWDRFIADRSPVLLDQPLGITIASAEARLSGRGGIDWTGGLFVSQRNDDGTSSARPADPATGLPRADIDPLSLRHFSGHLTQYAAFGDATVKVDDRFSVSAGARIFHYRRTAQGRFDIINVATDAGVDGTRVAYRYRASGVMTRLRADYRPAAGVLIYAQTAQGFRPGGINILPSLAPDLAPYRGDRLTSFEAGFRWGETTGRLVFDGALYHLRWSDMQYSALAQSGAVAFITNVGQARINGIELGLGWRALPPLMLRGSMSWTDARLAGGRSGNAGLTGATNGDRLPFVAPVAFTGTAVYQRKLGDHISMRAEMAAHYQSRFNSTFSRFDPLNLRLGDVKGIDLRLAVSMGRLDVTLYSDNVTNDRAGLLGGQGLVGGGDVVRVRPRTTGLTLGRRF